MIQGKLHQVLFPILTWHYLHDYNTLNFWLLGFTAIGKCQTTIKYNCSPIVNNTMIKSTDLEIPKVKFDADGELIITASPTSSKHDFDFYEVCNFIKALKRVGAS